MFKKVHIWRRFGGVTLTSYYYYNNICRQPVRQYLVALHHYNSQRKPQMKFHMGLNAILPPLS